MTSSSATDSNRQIGLALALVLGQEIIQKIAKSFQRLLDFRLGLQVFNHARIGARQILQFRNKVGIREMPHIEQQLHFSGWPKLVTKTHDLNPHRHGVSRSPEPLKQKLSERMHRVLRCIDHFVGQGPYSLHRGAFGADRITQALTAFCWMRPARLAETTSEDFVSRLEKQN